MFLCRNFFCYNQKTLFVKTKLICIFLTTLKHDYYKLEKLLRKRNTFTKMQIEKYFDSKTMSVHLRENTCPIAKKGVPGAWNIVKISDDKTTVEEIKTIAQEIMEVTESSENSFLEIERIGSTIIQHLDFRIVITRKPFSDGFEITAVRPVAKLNFQDYQLDEELKERLTQTSGGILIAGSPGEGKTTIARALAEYFSKDGKIVKTVESPRDMLLSEEITQYSLNHAERSEIHDVLLLSRPDKTFFDEMRDTKDFQLFADLRLAGIGMIGIVHATNPIDAIQRFIGRIEMGIIPQVVDTVVFVKSGDVDTVLTLKMMVKVPSGMTEADLARPLVEVRDFFTDKLEFEIYSYGDHTVVMPIEKKERKKSWQYAEEKLKDYFNKYSKESMIEFVADDKIKVYLPTKYKSKLIGDKGEEVRKVEKELQLKIAVTDLSKKQLLTDGQEVPFNIEFSSKNLIFNFDTGLENKEVALFSSEELIVRTKISKKAMIKVNINSDVGVSVVRAVKEGSIKVRLV